MFSKRKLFNYKHKGYFSQFIIPDGLQVKNDGVQEDFAIKKWVSHGKKVQLSFHYLKACLTSFLVLAMPDFTKELLVECEASRYGIGVVLMTKTHNTLWQGSFTRNFI